MPPNADMTIKIASFVTLFAFFSVFIWFAYKQYRQVRSSNMQGEQLMHHAVELPTDTQ
ncbi:hypothetical protein diail_12308, partial [Diaporthe ilicicola]